LDEAHDRLVERDAGRDEDGEDDGEPGELFASGASEKERDAERDRGEGVADVVDQVGEQRDRVREREDRELRCGRDGEDCEARCDCADAGARAQDRAVDEAVGVPVAVRV
jgi:hypothetical protein